MDGACAAPPCCARGLLTRAHSYGVFGYAVDGQDILRDTKARVRWGGVAPATRSRLPQVGDIIKSVKITRGAQNLVNGGKQAPAPVTPPPEEAAAPAE